MSFSLEPNTTTHGFWSQLGIQNPNSLIFPGHWISQEEEEKNELALNRVLLKESLNGQHFPLEVSQFIPTAEERLLDVMFFNIDRIDPLSNPHLYTGMLSSFPGGRPVVILFMGNASFYEDSKNLIEFYLSNGFKVLAFNYSGFGQSQGTPNQINLNEDAEAVYQFVKGFCSDEKQIFLHGFSIGGAVASSLARNHTDVTVILDKSFAKIEDIIPLSLRNLENSVLRRITSIFERFLVNTGLGYCNYNNLEALKNVRRVYVISNIADHMMGYISFQALQNFCLERIPPTQTREMLSISNPHNSSYLSACPVQFYRNPDLVKFKQQVIANIHRDLKAHIAIGTP
jgi:pimeloyl-ACP methyl ester carboxylesterase